MELLIFNNILRHEGIQALLSGNIPALRREVISFSEREGVTADGFREYIADLLANDENILSGLLKKGMKVGADLYEAALSDAEQIFRKLLTADCRYTPSGNSPHFYGGYARSIEAIVCAENPKELLDRLCAHYSELGCGVLAKFIAYKYEDGIKGVIPDRTLTFDSLIGLEHQKQVLLDNTKALIARKPSNNVLLFGDRGTGKSSCVKALLNMFYKEGLRVIEFPKEAISKIPEVMRKLSESPNEYIIFLDDLSFESHDKEYRALKIAMEGQLQATPDNVAVYATSNRRHLIKETWADREGGEVHKNDNMQETLSLSERFGISLVFAAPNQQEYLHIVRELLARRNIAVTADIEKAAIVWQMNYGSRNPRSAKQFVSSYLSKTQ